MNGKKLTMLVVCLSVLALLCVGCKVTGGGWIYSACYNNGNDNFDGKIGKANFGFNGEVEVDGYNYAVTGQFQYDDKDCPFNSECLDQEIPVRFHAELYGGTRLFGAYVFLGEYRTQPPIDDSTGTVIIAVVDNGKPNECDSEDTILVKCISGPLAGYFNEGKVQGGNIVNHDNDGDG